MAKRHRRKSGRGNRRSATAARVPRLTTLLEVGVPLLAGVQLAAFLLWSPARQAIAGLFLDDAYFYSVLARNFGSFHFLTLDGELPTNGVQPLWMGVQLLLAGLLPSVSELTRLAWSSWLVYLAFVYLAVRFLTRGGGPRAAWGVALVAGVLLLNPRFQAMVVQGLETPLCLLILMATLLALRAAASRASPLALGRTLALMLLATLCFFARTDLFWIPLGIAGWLGLTRRTTRRRLLAGVALAVALVVPYLAHNLATHGVPMPISGAVKMYYSHQFYPTWSAYLGSDEWTGMLRAFTAPFTVTDAAAVPTAVGLLVTLSLLGLAGMLVARRAPFPGLTPGGGPGASPAAEYRATGPDARMAGRSALRVIGLALAAHVLLMHGYYRVLQPRTAYYFAPVLVWVFLVLALHGTSGGAGAASRAKRPSRSLVAWRQRFSARHPMPVLAAAALLLAGVQWLQRDLSADPYWEQRMLAAQRIRHVVPFGERVAAFWPGLFAQFCGRLVTPLDGVIGSGAYFEDYVKPARELDYLLERARPYLAILLPEKLILEDEAGNPTGLQVHKELPHWTRLGAERIWESRKRLKIMIYAQNSVSRAEGGWYLLGLRPRQADAGAASAPPGGWRPIGREAGE